MSLFSHFTRPSQAQKRRVVVVGLDGTPFSLVERLMAQGDLPNLQRIVHAGSLRRMSSVYPVVSSTAWASFMTGRNPASHGIFGFVDCHPGTYKTYIPTGRNLVGPTLWEVLSGQKRRVAVMNVPVTYPPREVNGALVSCFLTPDVRKATYPASFADKLVEIGYRLDMDPWLARKSKDLLLEDFDIVFARRAEAMWCLLEQEAWDFFMIHIMETDRLQHFLWEHYEQDDSTYAPQFVSRYRQVDKLLGELYDSLKPDTDLVIVSDHGFASVKYEVYVNHWLEQAGWLRFKERPAQLDPKAAYPTLEWVDDSSRAFSLDPGRLYLNVQGRWPRGGVPRGEYRELRDALARDVLENLRDPVTGQPMIEKAIPKEELYRGDLFDWAPDLILVPFNGYDLKGAVNKQQLVHKGELEGMHTYDDALLYVSGREINKRDLSILDVMPTILHLVGEPVPQQLEGRVAVSEERLTVAGAGR